jgi:hypothetical protein
MSFYHADVNQYELRSSAIAAHLSPLVLYDLLSCFVVVSAFTINRHPQSTSSCCYCCCLKLACCRFQVAFVVGVTVLHLLFCVQYVVVLAQTHVPHLALTHTEPPRVVCVVLALCVCSAPTAVVLGLIRRVHIE